MLIGLGAVLLLLVGGGGFVSWKVFFSAPPSPPAPVRPAPKPAAPAAGPAANAPVAAVTTANPTASQPTPSSTLNSIAHAPAQAINKAQTVANAQGAGAQTTNDVVAAEDAAPKPPPPRNPKAAAAPTTTTTELAPGVSTSAALEGATDASPAFRTFVANLRVGGVAGGASPRALINGRLFRVGDVVDSALGVIFDGVKNNQIVFKDRTGAIVTRRY